MKTCTQCQLNKSESEFKPTPLTKDKLSKLCKECLRGRKIIKEENKPIPDIDFNILHPDINMSNISTLQFEGSMGTDYVASYARFQHGQILNDTMELRKRLYKKLPALLKRALGGVEADPSNISLTFYSNFEGGYAWVMKSGFPTKSGRRKKSNLSVEISS